MARATPRGPLATAEEQNEEGFTTVMSKSAKRRLRLELEEGRVCPPQEKNPSVELPRRAPDTAVKPQLILHWPPAPEEVSSKGSPKEKDEDEDVEEENEIPLPEWRLKSAGSFPSFYSALHWMEYSENLFFKVVNVSPAGEYLIRAEEWEDVEDLEKFAKKKPKGVVLEKEVREVKCVLVGYPVYLPMDPILDAYNVTSATRCFVNVGRGRRLPTRSVIVTLRRKLFPWLDLGSWGRYTLRKYVPEPLRCFRCQAFGHHQRNCARAEELCGACGGDHPTRYCRDRLRDRGEKPVPLCVNCGARHFAWHRSCPARLRRIKGAGLPTRPPGGRPPRPSAVENLPPADVGPGPTKQNRAAETTHPVETGPGAEGSKKKRDRRRRRHRRKGEKTTEGVVKPIPPPTPSAERTTQQPKERTEMGGGAVSKEKSTTTEAAARDSRSHNRRTQTSECWSFSEEELEDLLLRYEHLLALERVAQEHRISHEPALCCMRRNLRYGNPIPSTLPMSRQLKNPPRFRYHRGEKDWVYYKPEYLEEKADKATEEKTTSAVTEDTEIQHAVDPVSEPQKEQ